jgi:alpha-L-fucosidase
MMFTKTDYAVEDTSSAQLTASEAGVQRFVEAGYGLSVHWGLYTLLRGTEWVYYQQRVPWDNYRALMKRFDPSRFNASEWTDVRL